jgi:hypothetical protein
MKRLQQFVSQQPWLTRTLGRVLIWSFSLDQTDPDVCAGNAIPIRLGRAPAKRSPPRARRTGLLRPANIDWSTQIRFQCTIKHPF